MNNDGVEFQRKRAERAEAMLERVTELWNTAKLAGDSWNLTDIAQEIDILLNPQFQAK